MTTDVIALAKQVLALDEKATPAPWSHDGIDIFTLTDSGQGYPLGRYPDSVDVVIGKCDRCGNRAVGAMHDIDDALIATYRNAAPRLAKAVIELRAALAEACKIAEDWIGDATAEADSDRIAALRKAGGL